MRRGLAPRRATERLPVTEGPRQDGWLVSVQNTGAQPLRATVYVTCG
jgi:hypothetical protein